MLMLLVGNGKVITRDSQQPYFPDGCVLVIMEERRMAGIDEERVYANPVN
jgi:hypothetical protein